MRWRWDNTEPFGVNAPDENPINLGVFEFPVRFPGQYQDKETGTSYNVARDYWPEIGRYIQSDPMGIRAGLNTYLYVGGAPILQYDPDGLEVRLICRDLSFPADVASQHIYGRKQKHCFVQVKCPNEGINAVLSLFGDRWQLSPSRAKKEKNDSRDNPNSGYQDNVEVTPRNAECLQCCKYEKEVMARYDAFPSGWVPYDAIGWNSNSFADMLITSSSCRASVPQSIQDAPGFGMPR